jgi:hypothetical protein
MTLFRWKGSDKTGYKGKDVFYDQKIEIAQNGE